MKKRQLKFGLLILSSLLIIILIWVSIVSAKHYEWNQLKKNILAGDVSWTERFIICHPNFIFCNDKNGQPIHYAIQTGNIPMIKMLIHHGASINARDPEGLSPLGIAISLNEPDVVQFLMKNGADTRSGMMGIPPLEVAAFKNEVAIVKILLPYKGLLSQRGLNDGEQAFWGASCSKNPLMMKMLLDKGADVNVTDKYGMTVIYNAVSLNEVDCVKLLLAKGAKVNIECTRPVADCSVHTTPLHYAAGHNAIYIARILLAHGADPNIKNGMGDTPLDIAKENGYISMVKLLENHH